MYNPVSLSESQCQDFNKNGFVIVDAVIDDSVMLQARDSFTKLFNGDFETGVQPDEWNWKPGDDPDLTRQICNAWKADTTIASIVLRQDIGKACASLRQWPGARINQDNVIWKPAGAKALGFHQDDSYQQWIVPSEMMTCWITLDDTYADQGTIEYVRGSHLWEVSPPIQQFHAPENPLADLQRAADESGITGQLDIVPIEVPSGAAVLHHGRTWHGSRENSGKAPRRSVVAHCMSSDATFHTQHTSSIYSRYKHHNSVQMDESFFPITFTQDGYRSPWIDNWLDTNR